MGSINWFQLWSPRTGYCTLHQRYLSPRLLSIGETTCITERLRSLPSLSLSSVPLFPFNRSLSSLARDERDQKRRVQWSTPLLPLCLLQSYLIASVYWLPVGPSRANDQVLPFPSLSSISIISHSFILYISHFLSYPLGLLIPFELIILDLAYSNALIPSICMSFSSCHLAILTLARVPPLRLLFSQHSLFWQVCWLSSAPPSLLKNSLRLNSSYISSLVHILYLCVYSHALSLTDPELTYIL